MITVQLNDLYHEILMQLREAEQRASELRGQLQLVERLIRESQAVPIMSSDPLSDGAEEGVP